MNARGTWTLARCIEGLMQALEELAETRPGAALNQRVYRQLALGRPDLPDMATITRTAAAHRTTFTAIRGELITWRVKGAAGEPAILQRARELDALPKDDQMLTVLARGRAAERRRERIEREAQEPWAETLLDVLRTLGEPTPMKTLLTHTGWERNQTVKRMLKLEEAGRVERVNYGTSRRTVLWQLSSAAA